MTSGDKHNIHATNWQRVKPAVPECVLVRHAWLRDEKVELAEPRVNRWRSRQRIGHLVCLISILAILVDIDIPVIQLCSCNI